MKFKVCSTHFPAAWVGVEGLNLLRLDSRYYSPQYLKDDEMLNSEHFEKKTIGQMAMLVKDGPGGWAFKASEYTSKGVPVIRASDLINGLDLSNVVYITEEKHEELKQSECLPGDLVISVRGTPGRAAVVPNSVKKANLNAAVVRVRLKDKWRQNSQYITAYMNSLFGRRITERIANGAVQNNINLTEVRSIPVPIPDPKIQEYIGKKVALAEKCREEANRCENEANQLINTDIGEKPLEILSKIKQEGILKNGGFTVTVEPTLLRNRLDPVGYHPELLEIQKSFYGKKPKYQKLRKLVKLVTNERCRVNSSYSYYVSVLHVDNKGYLDTLAASEYYPESLGREAKVNDILVSCINPAANRIAVSDGMNGTIACSPEFAILESKGLPPHYIAFILRSDLVYRQIIHLGKGTSSSRRRIDEEELLDLEVPVVSKANQIAALIRKRQQLIAKAFQLIAKAKSDIESLIEGKLDTEAILSGKLKPLTWEDIEKELEGI